MKGNRVVVTGMGAVTPLGLDVDSSWAGICDGRSGAAAIEQFDAAAFTTRFSASVKILVLRVTSRPAMQDGWTRSFSTAWWRVFRLSETLALKSPRRTRRESVVPSALASAALVLLKNRHAGRQKGPQADITFFVPGAIINMIAGNLSILYNLQGPNLAVVTACTTGTHNIGLGARMIAAGDVDAMLVGGAEMATTPVGIGGFAAARALSTRNDDPSGPRVPGTRTETGSCSVMARACSCWSRWRVHNPEALIFIVS